MYISLIMFRITNFYNIWTWISCESIHNILATARNHKLLKTKTFQVLYTVYSMLGTFPCMSFLTHSQIHSCLFAISECILKSVMHLHHFYLNSLLKIKLTVFSYKMWRMVSSWFNIYNNARVILGKVQ